MVSWGQGTGQYISGECRAGHVLPSDSDREIKTQSQWPRLHTSLIMVTKFRSDSDDQISPESCARQVRSRHQPVLDSVIVRAICCAIRFEFLVRGRVAFFYVLVLHLCSLTRTPWAHGLHATRGNSSPRSNNKQPSYVASWARPSDAAAATHTCLHTPARTPARAKACTRRAA